MNIIEILPLLGFVCACLGLCVLGAMREMRLHRAARADAAAAERLAADDRAGDALEAAAFARVVERYRRRRRARYDAERIERAAGRAALLAMVDALPADGAVILVPSHAMGVYVSGLICKRRPDAAAFYFVAVPDAELEAGVYAHCNRDNDRIWPVIRAPGLALTRARSRKGIPVT